MNEDVYRHICPHTNHGFDREGRPIYIECSGVIDVPKLIKVLDHDTLVRRHIRQQEICSECFLYCVAAVGLPGTVL